MTEDNKALSKPKADNAASKNRVSWVGSYHEVSVKVFAEERSEFLHPGSRER